MSFSEALAIGYGVAMGVVAVFAVRDIRRIRAGHVCARHAIHDEYIAALELFYEARARQVFALEKLRRDLEALDAELDEHQP